MPLELRLEFMAIIRADHLNTKLKLFNHVIDKVDCIYLSMFFLDLERSNARRVVNSSILITLDLVAILSPEDKKLNVNLDVVTGNRIVVAFCVDLPYTRTARQPAHAVAFGIRYTPVSDILTS